jgi:hypothetical protein
VHIELLEPPPAPPALGEPGTDPPRNATEEKQWEGGRLILATFEPLDYVAGTGRFPSVTTFLSDGVVEVSHRGVRRRMGVHAGDAFWFEGGTRLTVVSDNPVGAAILQLYPRGRAGGPVSREPSRPSGEQADRRRRAGRQSSLASPERPLDLD